MHIYAGLENGESRWTRREFSNNDRRTATVLAESNNAPKYEIIHSRKQRSKSNMCDPARVWPKARGRKMGGVAHPDVSYYPAALTGPF